MEKLGKLWATENVNFMKEFGGLLII